MRRMDRQDGVMQLTFLLDCPDAQRLTELVDDLKGQLPEASFSFVDQGDMPR
jgi:hypothetical protein